MSQINIHVSPEFEENLSRYMRYRGIKTKSEAIRSAVREGLARARGDSAALTDFKTWLGMGLGAPLNPNPRFPSDDSLWW